MKYVHHSEYFCGNKISDYGLEQGYMDYRTLSKAFDAVLSNDLISKTQDIGYWDVVNGSDCYYYNVDSYDTITEEEYDELPEEEQIKYRCEYYDIYQYYIISDGGYNILSQYTDEIVFYNEELDLYIWGVTHYGTSWDYVLTNIKIDKDIPW